MTDKEKAKAYDEALEIAKNEINIKGIGETVELCERLFPELRESEDERIIKGLLSAFCDMKANYWIGMEVPKIVAWLEKQKENSKSVDSISSDCVSDAKCEDRWHKVGDSLPDSTREVLCKDAIGNYFIGRYYSKGVWEVSMYDDCDKSNEDNPPVVMWIDIPSEKQKEHLVDNSKTSADEDERIRKGLVNFLQSPFIKENLTDEKVAPWVAYLEKQKEQKPDNKCKGCNNVKGCINCVDGSEWAHIEEIEQKPAEWSEDWREEDIQTRFAFYTYKDDPSVLYLSNVFVEETSRNHGFGTRILRAAEKVAETIGATTISLKVKQDSPANAWYRKNGYGYVAFEDGYDWLEKNLEYMKPNKQE